MKKAIIFLSIILLITSCASKRYTKKASKFEKAGLVEDAAEYYYQAVKKKDSNVDAKLGLRKNGQLTLDRKLSDFTQAYKEANYKKAVYSYLDAEKYNNKIKAVRVELDFPEYHKEYYEEAKNDYLNKKYADGLNKLNQEDFTAALDVFKEIKGIDANYKDVKELFITAKYEPMYRDANQYLETELYRKAYYTFETIIKGAGTYKQSIALKDEAQQKGTITILVNDIKYSNYNYNEIALTITNDIKGELSKLNNPFIKIIDPSTIEANIFKNGQINMQAANLAGIKAILSGKITQINLRNGKLIRTNKRAYIKDVIITKNKEGEEIKKVKYTKTNYTEYEQRNSASIALNFQMISTKDNTIMVSDIINKQKSDKIHYAVYSGTKSKLVPGYWKYKNRDSEKDNVKDNKSDINKLHKLLKASKKIKSTQSLLNQIVNSSVKEVSKKINKYNPEK